MQADIGIQVALLVLTICLEEVEIASAARQAAKDNLKSSQQSK